MAGNQEAWRAITPSSTIALPRTTSLGLTHLLSPLTTYLELSLENSSDVEMNDYERTIF